MEEGRKKERRWSGRVEKNRCKMRRGASHIDPSVKEWEGRAEERGVLQRMGSDRIEKGRGTGDFSPRPPFLRPSSQNRFVNVMASARVGRSKTCTFWVEARLLKSGLYFNSRKIGKKLREIPTVCNICGFYSLHRWSSNTTNKRVQYENLDWLPSRILMGKKRA